MVGTPKLMLFITWAANLGGVQSSLLTRIRGLREFGVDADVMFLHSGNGRASFRGINTYVTKKPQSVRALLKRKRYQAISLINLTPFMPTIRTSGFAGKLIYELRGYSEHCLQVCSSLNPREFGGIVVPSRYVKELIIQNSPHQAPLIHHVYNAVDAELYRPRDIESLKDVTELGEDVSRPVLLWVGRLDQNKNAMELLRIVLTLRTMGHSFVTWIVTDSKVSKELVPFRKAVAEANLLDHLLIFENIPRLQMPRMYQAAAASGGCLISTSRSEGLQNTVLEAMACGCPVVTSAQGGNIELITHGENGATYQIGHPDEAAREVAQLFQDATRRAQYAERSLQRIHQHHTPKGHARAFLEVVAKIPAAKC